MPQGSKIPVGLELYSVRQDLAKEEGEGVYSIAFNPPQPGVYYGHVQCSSVHLPFGNPNYITVRVLPAESLKMGVGNAGQD